MTRQAAELADIVLFSDFASTLFRVNTDFLRILKPTTDAVHQGTNLPIFSENETRRLLGRLPAGHAGHLSALRAESESATWITYPHRLRRAWFENCPPSMAALACGCFSGLNIGLPFASLGLARFSETLPLKALARKGSGVLDTLACHLLPPEVTTQFPKWRNSEFFGEAVLHTSANELLRGTDCRLRLILDNNALNALLLDKNSNKQLWSLCALESWLRVSSVTPASSYSATTTTGNIFSTKELSAKILKLLMLHKISSPLVMFDIPTIPHAYFTKYIQQNWMFVYQTTDKNPNIPEQQYCISFDWCAKKTWKPLRKWIKKGVVACFLTDGLPPPDVRRKLRSIGILEVAFFDDGILRILTTERPGLWRRLRNLWGIFFSADEKLS
jgi:hypothetical protein